MRANQAVHAAAVVCRVLDVSASGYYAWRKRPPSRRALEDAELTARIREIHAMSDGTYGAPRIRAELADVDGRRVGVRHVARLMRKAGLAGVSRRRFCVTTTRDGSPAKPDLVERKFEAEGPNQLWVADSSEEDQLHSSPSPRWRRSAESRPTGSASGSTGNATQQAQAQPHRPGPVARSRTSAALEHRPFKGDKYRALAMREADQASPR